MKAKLISLECVLPGIAEAHAHALHEWLKGLGVPLQDLGPFTQGSKKIAKLLAKQDLQRVTTDLLQAAKMQEQDTTVRVQMEEGFWAVCSGWKYEYLARNYFHWDDDRRKIMRYYAMSKLRNMLDTEIKVPDAAILFKEDGRKIGGLADAIQSNMDDQAYSDNAKGYTKIIRVELGVATFAELHLKIREHLIKVFPELGAYVAKSAT